MEAVNYNEKLTFEPFEGEFSLRHGERYIYDAYGKILGCISKKCLRDLNGKIIAEFLRKDKVADENGKQVNTRLYGERLEPAPAENTAESDSAPAETAEPAETAAETADGEPLNGQEKATFRLVRDRVFLIEPEKETLIGTIELTRRDPVHIILLSALALLLAATIAFVALINLPFEGSPTINIRDNNGSYEGQGVIAVFDGSVKPGSSGEYRFIINNPYNVELDYSISIDKRYEGTQDIEYFPLQFRLRMNNALIESDRWLSLEELNFSELEMMRKSDQSFSLEWRWPFESDTDKDKYDSLDTILGKDNGKLSLVLNFKAEQGGNSL